jgi:hypothetical protein
MYTSMLNPCGYIDDDFLAVGAKERKVMLNKQIRCLPVLRYVQKHNECRGF